MYQLSIHPQCFFGRAKSFQLGKRISECRKSRRFSSPNVPKFPGATQALLLVQIHPHVPGSKLPLFPYNRGWETQPKSVGVYMPIIRIPYERWDDHLQYNEFGPWLTYFPQFDVLTCSLEHQLNFPSLSIVYN